MIYREFKGKKISALGMGAMRLPICDGGLFEDKQGCRARNGGIRHGKGRELF